MFLKPPKVMAISVDATSSGTLLMKRDKAAGSAPARRGRNVFVQN
jgi:hypothetical protein